MPVLYADANKQKMYKYILSCVKLSKIAAGYF